MVFNNTNIERLNPQKRRDLSIAFVPENRLGHSAVPELTLNENILLSQFPNNKFSKNGISQKVGFLYKFSCRDSKPLNLPSHLI